MATYKKCDETVYEMAKAILRKFETHGPLVSAKVKVDFVFAFAPLDDKGFPKGCALKLHGTQALGICKIVSLKDRALGHGDAEVSLDGDWWRDAAVEDRQALVDHELHHLVVKMEKGLPVRDDLGRPVLKMRMHDVDVGWFAIIAERHGKHSNEVRQAGEIMRAYQQYFWPDLRIVRSKNAGASLPGGDA